VAENHEDNKRHKRDDDEWQAAPEWQEVLRVEVVTNKLTTITIAHRINTILGNDNVLVMESGKAAEFGPTQKLASDPKKKFYSFVHAADGH